jgi:RNA 3'-terminal phosphate cyclase
MSWNIKKQGVPQEVLDAVKADPGAQYMPEGLPLLIEDLVSKTGGTVEVSTHGHVHEGIGEVHLFIAPVAEKENAAPAASEPA